MNHRNYLVVGSNFINKGAEAMLKTVRYHITQAHPDAKIFIICRYEERNTALDQGFIPVYKNRAGLRNLFKQLYEKSRAKLTKVLFLKPKPFADETPLRDMRRKIKKLDVAIDVSGYAYGDSRGFRQPLETIKAMEFAHAKGAKYVFMPQAWGSFKHPEVAANCRKMFGMADDFFVRDSVSQEYMAELLEKDPASLPVYPDIAFSFPKPPLEIGQKILDELGLKKEGHRILGISPNMRVYARSEGKGADNVYLKKLKDLIQYAISQQGFKIVLVPNEIRLSKGYHPDDRFLCGLLEREINDPENCFNVEGYHSAEEIKSVIGNTDFMVASRFHSLIFALSQEIPCLAISWSHKYKELFRLFDQEKFVVEDTALDNSSLFKLMDEMVEKEQALSEAIQKVLPKINEKLALPISKLK